MRELTNVAMVLVLAYLGVLLYNALETAYTGRSACLQDGGTNVVLSDTIGYVCYNGEYVANFKLQE